MCPSSHLHIWAFLVLKPGVSRMLNDTFPCRSESNCHSLFGIYNSHLIQENLYSQKDLRNQILPDEENRRNTQEYNINNFNHISKKKTSQISQRWSHLMFRSVTHLASINSIVSALTFVSLRKRGS